MNFTDAEELARNLDAQDVLTPLRAKFDIPLDVKYFDGNSLGPLTLRSREVLHHTIEVEWRERLIRSWNEDWLAMPLRVGNMIAPLIGATPDTVISCDNTSINLHKALMSAVALRPGRTEIVIDINNFPTDIYIAQSVADQHGMTLVAVSAEEIIQYCRCGKDFIPKFQEPDTPWLDGICKILIFKSVLSGTNSSTALFIINTLSTG